MLSRGKQVPGGACGFWGACGAGISAGMFISIVTGATPLSDKPWLLSNQMTAQALGAIGKYCGPRCCKRNSYLSIIEAVNFVKTNIDIEMELRDIQCIHSKLNNQCIGKTCTFKNKKFS